MTGSTQDKGSSRVTRERTTADTSPGRSPRTISLVSDSNRLSRVASSLGTRRKRAKRTGIAQAAMLRRCSLLRAAGLSREKQRRGIAVEAWKPYLAPKEGTRICGVGIGMM